MSHTAETWEFFRNASDEDAVAALRHVAETTSDLTATDEQLVETAKAMSLVARKASEEDFGEFLRSGELPAVKLSAAEMEQLQGGNVLYGAFLAGFAFGTFVINPLIYS